jgi:FtsP/CotA-like multicopper oxidase with cupredoxin domain
MQREAGQEPVLGDPLAPAHILLQTALDTIVAPTACSIEARGRGVEHPSASAGRRRHGRLPSCQPVARWQGAPSSPTQPDPPTSAESFPTDPSGLPEAGRPELLELGDGDTLELRVGPVAKRLGDTTVRMLGHNGSVPGPTLMVAQGSELVVHVVNQGDLDTTVHWHAVPRPPSPCWPGRPPCRRPRARWSAIA